jgi:hypothetical protein
VLYSWDDAFTLLPATALQLLEQRHVVRELTGGFCAWHERGTQPSYEVVTSMAVPADGLAAESE